MNKVIYCITTVKKWEHAKRKGEYWDKSLDNEGFIHCSYQFQLLRVANIHFKGISDLLILCIKRSKLNCKVIDEDLYNLNELYPHIYGPININSILEIIPFPCEQNGNFNLPKKIEI